MRRTARGRRGGEAVSVRDGDIRGTVRCPECGAKFLISVPADAAETAGPDPNEVAGLLTEAEAEAAKDRVDELQGRDRDHLDAARDAFTAGLGGSGTGPRAGTPRDELVPEMTVRVKPVARDIESGHPVINDPDYLEPPGKYVEMPLKEAVEKGGEFCVDCFTAANISQPHGDGDE